jgi:GntR family L-lactate dehydrogenase operon transcriptional regulator
MAYVIEQLARGRPRRYSQMLDYEILKVLSEHEEPVGSGTLEIELRKRGFHVSAPTVGRKLRELEVERYLVKVSVLGRKLSETGRTRLRDLEREVSFQNSSEALQQLIASGSKEEILGLLEARRIIEREIIRLVVRKAVDRDLDKIELLLERQEDRVGRGELAVAEDVRFHDMLAEIAGNPVLRWLLSILRQEGKYSFVVAYIRTRVGGRLAVDHREILRAIRARDGMRAQHAVDAHLRKLMRDVENYWRQAVRGTESRYEETPPVRRARKGR